MDRPALPAEAILCSRIWKKHRLSLWIILPSIVVLSKVLMEQLRLLLLLPLW